MQEYHSPGTSPVPETGNLTDDVVANARHRGDQVGFSRRVDGQWNDLTYAEFYDDVLAAAKGLLAAGVQPGDPVALISRTRLEWTVLDYAIWFAGAATVPIYETSSSDQIHHILSDSGAVLAFAETADHVQRIHTKDDAFTRLRRVLCIDSGDLAAFLDAGAHVTQQEVAARRDAVGPGDLATVIYTSGTTGPPKGCALTHANFLVEIDAATQALDTLFDADGSSTLLFLPLAHVFARIIALGCVRMRVRLGLSADIKALPQDLAAFQPTFLLAVPRVFEKVFNQASQQATAAGRGRIFDAAANAAVAYSEALGGRGPGLLLRARHRLFEALVYGRVRHALGGATEYAVSGGAPLGERLAHFFRGIGVPVLEGYGLTETTAALTVNTPNAHRIGTVGKPLPGTAVRVADDGELCFRGGQVFAGYWHNEQATAEVFADGWFRSGDLGEVDDDGFVRVTGRQKEILVTAGGKNVAPGVLEDRVRAHPLVGQCLVVGDGRPFVAALVTLDTETLPEWARAREKAYDLATLAADPDVREEVQRAVDDANQAVSRAEGIRTFTILSTDWSQASGEVTPTLKLKRNVVLQNFHDVVESMYL